MQVFVCKGFSGEIARMEIDGESSLENQIESMANKIFGVNADRGVYLLINLTRDSEYSATDIIRETTSENDILLLVKSDNDSGFQ